MRGQTTHHPSHLRSTWAWTWSELHQHASRANGSPCTTPDVSILCTLQHLGVDVDTLLLCQPDSGEMALEVADSLIR